MRGNDTTQYKRRRPNRAKHAARRNCCCTGCRGVATLAAAYFLVRYAGTNPLATISHTSSRTAFKPAGPLWLALLLALAGVGALAVDLPVTSWLLHHDPPGLLAKLATLSEAFGHGAGVAMLLVAIYVLDPARRVNLPRVAAASLGAGLAANVLKLLLGRMRPHHLPEGFNFAGSVFDTFGSWLPLAGGGSGAQSFPSAHSATAAGLAVVLAHFYPRGRWLFAALAALVVLQRLLAGAHYLSDTLLGAALGCLVAGMCLRPRLLGGWFDRLEHVWQQPDHVADAVGK